MGLGPRPHPPVGGAPGWCLGRPLEGGGGSWCPRTRGVAPPPPPGHHPNLRGHTEAWESLNGGCLGVLHWELKKGEGGMKGGGG